MTDIAEHAIFVSVHKDQSNFALLPDFAARLAACRYGTEKRQLTADVTEYIRKYKATVVIPGPGALWVRWWDEDAQDVKEFIMELCDLADIPPGGLNFNLRWINHSPDDEGG